MTPALRLSAYFCAYFLYAGALVPYFALYLAARGYDAGQIAVVLAMPQLARVVAPAFWGWPLSYARQSLWTLASGR